MRLKFAIPLAIATASLPCVSGLKAVNYVETGDAGDLPSAAQIITTPVGNTTTAATLTTQINGSLSLTNGISDSDMFQFTLSFAATLTVSDNFFVAGANNFDSQIALFTTAGVGIAANDDAASGGSQSTLTFSLAPGNYDLLISGSGRYAVDSAGALIFKNFTDGTTDPSATVTAQSTNPIAGYTGSSNEGGNYQMRLNAVPNVPEPTSFAAAVTLGASGLAWVLRRRRA